MAIIKRFIQRLFVCMVGFGSVSINANINEAMYLKLKEHDHTLYCLSENHISSRRNSLVQIRRILHFLRERTDDFLSDVSLIVEDPSNTTNKKLSLSDLYQRRMSIKTPSHYLTSLAHCAGIMATNVEFRTTTTKSVSCVSIDKVIQDAQRLLQEINEYDDGPIANQYYNEIVSRHTEIIAPSCKEFFERMKAKGRNITLDIELPEETDNVASLYRPLALYKGMEDKEQVMELLIDFDAELLDARLVHTILMHQKRGKKKTVVSAGGWHLSNICLTLSRLGYRFCDRIPRYFHDPLHLVNILQEYEPEYNPHVRLPKTKVDLLLDYIEFEYDHPRAARVIPETVLLGIIGIIGYIITTLLVSNIA